MEKKKQNILLLIMGLLIIAELVNSLCLCQQDLLASFFIVCSLVFVALYGFYLYKKPHGNMLKYAMLITSLSVVVDGAISISMNSNLLLPFVFRLLSACALCYVAGRLNRIEQNKYILPTIDIIYFVVAILGIIEEIENVGTLAALRYLSTPITVLTLIIAYFTRYKEHKEAGLTDK